jgi:transcriptional regulator with GAF, ATPase, and Fis domain
LDVVTNWLPPLRERGEDLPLLSERFLERFGRELAGRSPNWRQRRWTFFGATRDRATCASCRA